MRIPGHSDSVTKDRQRGLECVVKLNGKNGDLEEGYFLAALFDQTGKAMQNS
jgi:hypothetical protein